MNSTILRYMYDNLDMLNLAYYYAHKEQFVKIGDEAKCSHCHRVEIVRYMYGGKSPLCRDCCKDILN